MVILQLKEQPPLIQAIFYGELETVKKLLESKQDVNYQDFEKRSALHAAAFRGDSVITKLLIDHGARVNTRDCKWVTPLHTACYSGSEQTVTVLLNNSADTYARDRLWQTPLHVAAACNSVECVSNLLDKIQNPNVTDRSGRTALHHAALNGHTEIVELLISRGCIVNACDKKDCRPIHWAAYKGHAETIEILLQNGADINAKDRNQYTPLHVAAASGAATDIDVLIENGANLEAQNAYGNTPLHIACLNGHGNVAIELVGYKADKEAVNYRGQTPLHLAAASTHGVHCLNMLVSHNVNINKQSIDGRTPLHMTAIHGRFTRSKTLIDKGAIVDSADKNGCTALHIAAQYGHELLSNTLLLYGAEPRRKGYEGRTPLHMCCLSGYIECCRIFIKAGVDLNDKDNTGKTPLHCAAYKGAVECVDLLVSSGADFKITDNVGRIPLHYAAAQGFFFCVFTLVGIGSPVNLADHEGCTALHLAAAFDVDGRCVNYLIEHKADPKLKDCNGFTSIHYAVAGNNVNALKYLLYAVGNYTLWGPDMPLTTPLHIAARNGNMEILEKLMSYFPDPNIRNEHGCTPLLLAARHGHAGCVQLLLRFGAKVSICDNINGLSPVHHSAKNGHVHCLALLVDNAENKSVIDLPDGLQRTALMLAVSNSHIDCVTTLIKSGADSNVVDGDNHSCLFRAVVTGQHNILQILLPRSTVVNKPDVHGKTVLHVAAACGRISCVQRILPYMDTNVAEATDNKNFTALHWACYSGNANCVAHFFDEGVFKKLEGNAFSPVHCAASIGSEKCLRLLCAQYGPQIVSLRDDRSRNPLHVVALHGHGECATFLLDQGADINTQDENGRTALISAAYNGQVQVLEILINRKADVTLYDKNGNTALHMACLRRYSHAALFLLEFINDSAIINMVNNDRKTPLHLTARNGLVDVTRQLILKGSSVTVVDSNGLTPALCCAPNPNVAQCLAIILASHSLQSSSGKDSLDYLKASAISGPPIKKTVNESSQTDITLIADPDAFELEKIFDVKLRKPYTDDAIPEDASRFFIHYKSTDTFETKKAEKEATVSLEFDEDYAKTSVFELHSSHSDTVLAPKPIYSEEDYEKMIRRSGEDRTDIKPILKSTKAKVKDDLQGASTAKHEKKGNFKSKSAASVLTTFRSDNFGDSFPRSDGLDQGKDGSARKKSERPFNVLERYTGVTPKSNRFPKATNKRLKAQKVEEEDFRDYADRCHICKQFLGSLDYDEQNIPLETMQTAIEKVLSKKGQSTNRCLLAFLDESYELNAKNAHLIYHGILSPRCEPYIARYLNLTQSEIEILESPGDDGSYVVRRSKSASMESFNKSKFTKTTTSARNKDQAKATTSRNRLDKSKTISNKTSKESKLDLRSKMSKDDFKTGESKNKPGAVFRKLKETKKSVLGAQKNSKSFTIALDEKRKCEAEEQVQKVQSDNQKIHAKAKKSKNFSTADIPNQPSDFDGKMDVCGEKPSGCKEEMKKHPDSGPFPDYLKPLTNFHLDPLIMKEDGNRVRCYPTYWCISELTDSSRPDEGEARGETRSESQFARREDETPSNQPVTATKSEAIVKKPGRIPAADEIEIAVEKDEMIFFNEKVTEESACNSTPGMADTIDDEEIEELERLRRLDEMRGKDETSEVVQDILCNLQRRAGVMDIKNSSDDVEDWCEDMQCYVVDSSRKEEEAHDQIEKCLDTTCVKVKECGVVTSTRLLSEVIPTAESKAVKVEALGEEEPIEIAAGLCLETPKDLDERTVQKDSIEIHYDNRATTAISSEYCVGMKLESKHDFAGNSKSTVVDKSIEEDISMFSDIPTVTEEEHLVKSTILNEQSESFLASVQNKDQARTQPPSPVTETAKNPENNEDKFIMKKPTRKIENSRKKRDDKAINWKLYMAHRCLQLSDNMNEDYVQRCRVKKREEPTAQSSSFSTKSSNKKKRKENAMKSEFRKQRSPEEEDHMKDSFRFTGLKFEEYEGTVKIDEIIARENVEKPRKVAFSERILVLKDQETTYSLHEDLERENAKENSKENLANWQAYIEEGSVKIAEEDAPLPDENDISKSTDFVGLPKKTPKSFLEIIDIKDFVPPDPNIALPKILEEMEKREEDVDKLEETQQNSEINNLKKYMSNLADIDYELDKLEEELKKDIDVDKIEGDVETVEEITKTFEEAKDEEACEEVEDEHQKMLREYEAMLDIVDGLESKMEEEGFESKIEIMEENIVEAILKEDLFDYEFHEEDLKLEETPEEIARNWEEGDGDEEPKTVLGLTNEEVTYKEEKYTKFEENDETIESVDIFDRLIETTSHFKEENPVVKERSDYEEDIKNSASNKGDFVKGNIENSACKEDFVEENMDKEETPKENFIETHLLCLDGTSEDTIMSETPAQENRLLEVYPRYTPSDVSSKESEDDFDMIDSGFSHVKVDELSEYHRQRPGGDNQEKECVDVFSTDSLDDNSEIAVKMCRSSLGEGEGEEICHLETTSKEEDQENPSSDEHTTSADKSEEYHDANMLDMEDMMPDDNDEVNENIYYDTESDNSVSQNETVGEKSRNVIYKDVGDDILVTVDIQERLEKIITEKCLETSLLHGNKKISSQKSVHFKFGDEEALAGDCNEIGKSDSEILCIEKNDKSCASLNTIYLVGQENTQGIFLESESDMNCLSRTLCENKIQPPFIGKQLKERISLIEGVAPSEGQILEKEETIKDDDLVKDAPNEIGQPILDKGLQVLEKSSMEIPDEVGQNDEAPSENSQSTIVENEEITVLVEKSSKIDGQNEPKREESNKSIEDLVGKSSKIDDQNEPKEEESKKSIEDLLVIHMQEDGFANVPIERISVSSLKDTKSNLTISSRIEDDSKNASPDEGSVSEQDRTVSSSILSDTFDNLSKVEEVPQEVDAEKRDYPEIFKSIKLTQYVMENESANVSQEDIEKKSDSTINQLPQTSTNFKRTVKISRNMKVDNSEESLLFEDKSGCDMKKNKKFASVSKLGKKAKKDSNFLPINANDLFLSYLSGYDDNLSFRMANLSISNSLNYLVKNAEDVASHHSSEEFY